MTPSLPSVRLHGAVATQPLTSDCIEGAADAGQRVHVDARRWRIKMNWRDSKTSWP
jgi:hypothetical protein